MNILHIDSSPLTEKSVSRYLTALAVSQLAKATLHALVTRRDLCADDIPHLRRATLAQIRNIEPTSQDADTALSVTLVQEVLWADVLVIGAPMYNFSVPSHLKAWIDRVVWAGKTFRYTPQGAQGLCAGRRAFLVSSRGGIYSTPEKEHFDFQESYLRTVMGFIGITDVRVFRAEGLAMPERRASSIAAAEEEIIAALASV